LYAEIFAEYLVVFADLIFGLLSLASNFGKLKPIFILGYSASTLNNSAFQMFYPIPSMNAPKNNYGLLRLGIVLLFNKQVKIISYIYSER